MPLRHGLDVSVVSSSRELFTEYGVNTHARSKLVTAKIEARSGVQFLISIRPEDPFRTEKKERHGSSTVTRAQATDLAECLSTETPLASRKSTSKFRPFDLDTHEYVDQHIDKPFPDTKQDKNLSVENLPLNVDELRLRQEFEEFGDLTGVIIIRHRETGESQWYTSRILIEFQCDETTDSIQPRLC
jgi:RNA recognition motif. (a.k.a. RRM, RBD, or RNP domain)